MFAQAAAEIRRVIGSYLVNIDHTGSTAVPGLAAKPVIDILISARSLAEAPLFLPPLEALGYTYVPGHEAVFPQRRYLHRILAGEHIHHLHIVEPASDFYRDQLAFRDHLRSHPESASQYAALKARLAAQYRDDRDAYTDGKTVFIKSILAFSQPNQ